jgi:hypothetical protein
MQRGTFHPRRLVVSVIIVLGLVGSPFAGLKILAILALVVLFCALIILPAWIMDPKGTPDPPGRGRSARSAKEVQLRRRDEPPPLDRAARLADPRI